MRKHLKKSLCIILAVILLLGTAVVAFAADNPIIESGQTHNNDFISFGDTVTNNGIILGDFIAAGQTVSMDGEVEGDVIAGSSTTMKISGKVGGSARIAGNEVNLSADVVRNAMIFGINVNILPEARIHKNAYIYATKLTVSGEVLGNLDVYASDISLDGKFEGNVTIHNMEEGAKLNIAPGTSIKGKLTYEGVKEYSVPSGVTVGSFEYIKIAPVTNTKVKPAFNYWDIVKKIFTLVIYYLVALLLYKLFPRFFAGSGEFIAKKPLTATGFGVATLGSLVGGSLLLVLILIMTVFLFKSSVFFFGGLVFVFIATLTIIFADIPVSLWLGGIISKKAVSVPARLAIGLVAITAVKLALELLTAISAIATLVGVVKFLLYAAIWILGAGSIIKTIFEIMKAANIKAKEEAEEAETEELQLQ